MANVEGLKPINSLAQPMNTAGHLASFVNDENIVMAHNGRTNSSQRSQ